MSNLEEKLRVLAGKGELTYLSLVSVAGKGDYGVVFHAIVSPSSRFGHYEARDADPVKALVAALDTVPTSKPRETTKIVAEKPEPRRKTVSVGELTGTGALDEPWDMP